MAHLKEHGRTLRFLVEKLEGSCMKSYCCNKSGEDKDKTQHVPLLEFKLAIYNKKIGQLKTAFKICSGIEVVVLLKNK